MLDPQFLITFVPVLLLALTLHEFGHAWTAVYFGDPTPKEAGRFTLTPSDTSIRWARCLCSWPILGGPTFTGKPGNFTHPRADLWVSLAGIMANLVQAVLYAGIWHALRYTSPAALGVGVSRFLILGIMLNLSLALFNLLPIFPLDGSHVAKNLLPRRQAYWFSVFSERYGALLLFGLLLVGYVSQVSPLSLLIGIPRNWLAGLLLRGI